MFKNEANRFFNASDDNYQDFGWHEFTLEELGLPPAEDILKGVKAIEKEVGLIGWRTKDEKTAFSFFNVSNLFSSMRSFLISSN